MYKTVLGLAAGAAAFRFALLRRGWDDVAKMAFHEDKHKELKITHKRNLLWDTILVTAYRRDDVLIHRYYHDDYPCGPVSQSTFYWSFKPISYAIVPFYRKLILEGQLFDEMSKISSSDCKEEEAKARLRKVIDEFE